MTTGSGSDPKEPHWFLLILVAALLSLVLTWLGVNDWRPLNELTPTAPPSSSALPSAPSPPAPSMAPTSASKSATPTASTTRPRQTTNQPTDSPPPVSAPEPRQPQGLRLEVTPPSLDNRGVAMGFTITASGGSPDSGVDIEIPSQYSDTGGGCAEFSGAGCSLVSSTYIPLNSAGTGTLQAEVYPCALLNRQYDPSSVQGTYTVWGRDRASQTITTTTFSIQNVSGIPPVNQWQSGGCS